MGHRWLLRRQSLRRASLRSTTTIYSNIILIIKLPKITQTKDKKVTTLILVNMDDVLLERQRTPR